MCMFTSFPNFALFVFICQFQGFLPWCNSCTFRHRETIDVLNGSPQPDLDCELGYCCICGIWLLFRVEGGFYFLYVWTWTLEIEECNR